jgi:hypothetical protein
MCFPKLPYYLYFYFFSMLEQQQETLYQAEPPTLGPPSALAPAPPASQTHRNPSQPIAKQPFLCSHSLQARGWGVQPGANLLFSLFRVFVFGARTILSYQRSDQADQPNYPNQPNQPNQPNIDKHCLFARFSSTASKERK